jgi:hypothetical protein
VVGGYNFVNPTGVGNGGYQVVELQWDANPEGSVTGYEVLRGATSVCGGQTNLANSCLDSSPPTTSGTVTTYTVKTWYRDANNAYQSVSTNYSVTAPGTPIPTQYWLASTTANTGSPCLNAGGTRRDMVSTAPAGFFTWVSSSTTVTGCLPAFPSGITMTAGTMTVQSYWTNPSNSKSCSVSWLLHLNGSTLLGTTNSVTVPAGTSNAVLVTNTVAVSARSFTAGNELDIYTAGGAANSNCSNGPTTLWWNSTVVPTNLTLPLAGGGPALSTPNTISGLSVTVNADGTRTLNWTAPTSSSTVPAPDFYRIYRDGTAIANRVDATDAINTTVATASSAGATTLTVANGSGYAAGQSVLVDTGANQDTVTVSSVSGNTITFTGGMTHAHAVGVPVVVRAVSWTDTATGGTSHTYRVSAASVNLAESAFSPSAGVTG